MSDSLQPHGLQHAKLPCLSPAPRACSDSCPSSLWCHPTISSSVVPFSSCLQCSLGISNFLKETSSLSHSIVFLYFFHWSLRKAFLSLLSILRDSAFKWVYLSFSPLPLPSLLFSAICKVSSDNHFAFLHFFFLGMVLITASYTMSWTSIHSSPGRDYQI